MNLFRRLQALHWGRFIITLIMFWPMIGAAIYMLTLTWPEHTNNYLAAILVGLSSVSLIFWIAAPFIVLRSGSVDVSKF